jgi:hypothetical protein
MAMNSQQQDTILTNIAKEMQTDLDREIMWGMLKDMGWTRVMISRLQDNNHAVDITYWLGENIKHPFERNGRDFIFEDPKDASMFILRWL